MLLIQSNTTICQYPFNDLYLNIYIFALFLLHSTSISCLLALALQRIVLHQCEGCAATPCIIMFCEHVLGNSDKATAKRVQVISTQRIILSFGSWTAPGIDDFISVSVL